MPRKYLSRKLPRRRFHESFHEGFHQSFHESAFTEAFTEASTEASTEVLPPKLSGKCFHRSFHESFHESNSTEIYVSVPSKQAAAPTDSRKLGGFHEKLSRTALEAASTKSWKLHPRNFTFCFHGSFRGFHGISAASTTAPTETHTHGGFCGSHYHFDSNTDP